MNSTFYAANENQTAVRIKEALPGVFQTLHIFSQIEGCVNIELARSAVRNAFNETMILELSQVFYLVASRFTAFECRAVVLTGQGSVFCAGADLAMMKELGEASFDVNLEDSRKLAQLFSSLSTLPVPVVSIVQGAAIGGGFGLTVCSDIVVTHAEAVFATSEVRLGLIPAVISPYIVRKLGVAASGYPLLSGTKLSGTRAFDIQLAQVVVSKTSDLQEAASVIVNELLLCAPESVRETKKLLFLASPLPTEATIISTVQAIARARGTQEARYGLSCFFEKKLPDWAHWSKNTECDPFEETDKAFFTSKESHG